MATNVIAEFAQATEGATAASMSDTSVENSSKNSNQNSFNGSTEVITVNKQYNIRNIRVQSPPPRRTNRRTPRQSPASPAPRATDLLSITSSSSWVDDRDLSDELDPDKGTRSTSSGKAPLSRGPSSTASTSAVHATASGPPFAGVTPTAARGAAIDAIDSNPPPASAFSMEFPSSSVKKKYAETAKSISANDAVRLDRLYLGEVVVPDDTPGHVKHYMGTNLWDSELIIPLWNSSPRAGVRMGQLRYSALVGDIGRFHSNGSFEPLFNIFLSEAQNRERKCRPPPGFKPFPCLSIERFLEFVYVEGQSRVTGFITLNEPQDMTTAEKVTHRIKAIPTYTNRLEGSFVEVPRRCQRLGIPTSNANTVKNYVLCYAAEWCAYESNFLPPGEPNLTENPLIWISDSYRAPYCASAAIAMTAPSTKPVFASLIQPDPGSKVLKWKRDTGIITQTDHFADALRPLSDRIPEEFCVAVSGYAIVPPKEKKDGWLKLNRRTESLRSTQSTKSSFSKRFLGFGRKKNADKFP